MSVLSQKLKALCIVKPKNRSGYIVGLISKLLTENVEIVSML